jgi:hypothetical protein
MVLYILFGGVNIARGSIGAVRNNKCRLEPEEFNQRRGSNQREPLFFIIPPQWSLSAFYQTKKQKNKKQNRLFFLSYMSVFHFSSSCLSAAAFFLLLAHSLIPSFPLSLSLKV